MELGCYILLKGRYTFIGTPEGQCFINLTGNPALATAGAGDVLAGYLTGFLARGLNMLEASTRAVFLHGYAGDLLQLEFGDRGSIARDILRKLQGMDRRLIELINEEGHYDDEGLDFDLIHNPN